MNLETVFGVRFTFLLPVDETVYGETGMFMEDWENFCAFDFLFTVLKKYMENTHQKTVIFAQGKTLPCIAPLLTTVEETPQVISARVQGHLPEWLNGYLLRTGPGKFEFGKDK